MSIVFLMTFLTLAVSLAANWVGPDSDLKRTNRQDLKAIGVFLVAMLVALWFAWTVFDLVG